MARKASKKRKAAKKTAAKKTRSSTPTRKRAPAKAGAPVIEALAISRPVERVWQALTTPRDLGLITLGRVEMEPRPGTPMRWSWKVWKEAAPVKNVADWQGQVIDVVPGSTLVLGPYPLTTITVKGEGDETLVTVVQAPPRSGDSEDYEEGWADFLFKLKTQLETRHWEHETLTRFIAKATPRKLLASLVDDKAMRKVLPGKTKTEKKVGKRFSWQPTGAHEAVTGVFLELVKDRRLRFTWEATRPASQVTIEAHPVAYGSLVSVHHTGLGRLGRAHLLEQRRFWLRLCERLRCYHYYDGKIRAQV